MRDGGRHRLGGDPVQHDAVGDLARQLEHLGTERGQHDAHGRGRRHEAKVLHTVKGPLEVHALARGHEADDLHGLADLRERGRELQPVPLLDDDPAREPDAERDAARGQVAERRRAHPEQRRRARLDGHDGGAHVQGRAVGGDGRHHRDGVVAGGFARPRRVIPARLRLAHDLHELGGGQRGRPGEHEAEPHQAATAAPASMIAWWAVTARQYTRWPPMRLLPEVVLTPDGWRRDVAIVVTDGRIADVGAAGPPRAGDVALTGRALLPGTVNAHCHTFQSLLRGLGDDLDFAGWRDRVLYPFSERLDRDGIGLGAAFAFAEMLRHGVTTCVDFFYLNDGGHENAEAVIAAARAVGIRLVLARTMYDWEGAPKRYRESSADAARRVRELIAAHRHDATVDVHAAPHSPHGASPTMIRAGWEVAETENVPMHVHVAEGRYEGERTLREHGATPVRHLDRLGALGARTIAVHAVWLDDEEVALMGARGAALAYCPSSNMFLGDGVTRLPELLRAGVRVGLGTDGGCTNNRLSVFEEMRMASLLQRVRLLDGGALPATTVFGLGTESGAAILGLDAGRGVAGRRDDGRRLARARLGHAAMALEDDAFLHDHHRRLDVAEDPRGAAQLHALGAEHVAHDFAVDENHPRADGGVDHTLLADDERVVRGDLALELPVQHDGAAERVLAFEVGRLVDERGEVVGAGGHAFWLLPEDHGRSPGLGCR